MQYILNHRNNILYSYTIHQSDCNRDAVVVCCRNFGHVFTRICGRSFDSGGSERGCGADVHLYRTLGRGSCQWVSLRGGISIPVRGAFSCRRPQRSIPGVFREGSCGI